MNKKAILAGLLIPSFYVGLAGMIANLPERKVQPGDWSAKVMQDADRDGIPELTKLYLPLCPVTAYERPPTKEETDWYRKEK